MGKGAGEEATFLVDGERIRPSSVTFDGNVNQNATVTEWATMQFEEDAFRKIAEADEARFKIGVSDYFTGYLTPEIQQDMLETIRRAENVE